MSDYLLIRKTENGMHFSGRRLNLNVVLLTRSGIIVVSQRFSLVGIC